MQKTRLLNDYTETNIKTQAITTFTLMLKFGDALAQPSYLGDNNKPQ